jgi:hypothetical protein
MHVPGQHPAPTGQRLQPWGQRNLGRAPQRVAQLLHVFHRRVERLLVPRPRLRARRPPHLSAGRAGRRRLDRAAGSGYGAADNGFASGLSCQRWYCCSSALPMVSSACPRARGRGGVGAGSGAGGRACRAVRADTGSGQWHWQGGWPAASRRRYGGGGCAGGAWRGAEGPWGRSLSTGRSNTPASHICQRRPRQRLPGPGAWGALPGRGRTAMA